MSIKMSEKSKKEERDFNESRTYDYKVIADTLRKQHLITVPFNKLSYADMHFVCNTISAATKFTLKMKI